jgi:hypothetical protein
MGISKPEAILGRLLSEVFSIYHVSQGLTVSCQSTETASKLQNLGAPDLFPGSVFHGNALLENSLG